MPAKVLVDECEYLQTSFEGADREYLDGEVVERNRGEEIHSNIQTALILFLALFRQQLGIRVQAELRVRTREGRYRVPDVAVWR